MGGLARPKCVRQAGILETQVRVDACFEFQTHQAGRQAENSGRILCYSLGEKFLPFWETSLLLRPSVVSIRPTHVMENKLLYLKSAGHDVNPTYKIHSQQHRG